MRSEVWIPTANNGSLVERTRCGAVGVCQQKEWKNITSNRGEHFKSSWDDDGGSSGIMRHKRNKKARELPIPGGRALYATRRLSTADCMQSINNFRHSALEATTARRSVEESSRFARASVCSFVYLPSRGFNILSNSIGLVVLVLLMREHQRVHPRVGPLVASSSPTGVRAVQLGNNHEIFHTSLSISLGTFWTTTT